MRDERKGRQPEQLILTATQEGAAQSILSSLKVPQDQRTLVILSGLSGIGKSAVLDHVQAGIGLNGAKIVEGDDIIYDSRAKEMANYHGHLVTTTTVGEVSIGDSIEQVARKRYQGVNIVMIVLPGMNEMEITSYIANLPNSRQATLSQDQIARFSLGIPLLAQQLATPGLTEDIAVKITAKYLHQSFRQSDPDKLQAESQSFLRMPIPDTVIQSVREMEASWTTQHVYDDLHLALQTQAELREQEVFEESPLFIAPESEQIYDTMMQSDGVASIDIFVPSLRPEDLDRIKQAFGCEDYGKYEEYQATRPKMFGATYRKVSFWHKDANGEEVMVDNESYYLEGEIKGYWKALQKGELSLQSTKGRPISFFIHSHEHHGMTYAPSHIGWMTETLLQQRGIPYFVNNDTYGTSYVYRPDSKKIEVLPKLVKIDRWG